MANKTFELLDTASGKKSTLPVRSGTVGPDVIDIGALNKDHGVFTFDPGFMATASTESKVTYIDGDAGVLLYRGYPIEQLAAHSSFIEVAYLLNYGDLPDAKQLADFTVSIQRHTMINESLLRMYNGFHYDAHPMAMVSAIVASMSAFYHDSMDINNPRHREIFMHRIIAKLPTISAAAYKRALGQPFIYPRNDLDYCSNLLHMFYAVPCEPYHIDPLAAQALDLLLILHADHEQNCSTSTVRLVGSAQANLFASVSAGINALFGPLHGGANEAVLDMLNDIRLSGESVQRFVERVKNKEEGIRLMGFGHRIYKNFDPRATIVKATADKVLADLGISDPLLDIAKQLEETALADPYFAERKLYPNVDFYTGLIYKAMGFPPRMFTPLFALGRLPGWISHWREMMQDPNNRIGRPQQVYLGEAERSI